MYDRQVDGRMLTFGVSGLLWERNLVMIDSETESLWSQMLGEAMRGPLQGETLETIPSVVTEWGSWRERHPDTTVAYLPRTVGHYVFDYFDPGYGEFVVGLQTDVESRIWSLTQLSYSQSVINDRFSHRPVLVVCDREARTAMIYERVVDGRELMFEERDGKLVDRETESEWDRWSGVALTPPMKGHRLKKLPAVFSNHEAWAIYHPTGTMWNGGTQ